jgi:hypothetical protein
LLPNNLPKPSVSYLSSTHIYYVSAVVDRQSRYTPQ